MEGESGLYNSEQDAQYMGRRAARYKKSVNWRWFRIQ